MRTNLVRMLLLSGVFGLLWGYPELAYISGAAGIWAHISEDGKRFRTPTISFWIALLVGIGFASISPFKWWQGILIGFTIVGAVMTITSFVSLLFKDYDTIK